MTISPASIRRATVGALEHLPKTFDETWLRETWAGGHGRLRLRSELTRVHSAINLAEHGMSGTAAVGGAIVRRSGGTVGSVTRNVNLEPNGRLGVYHAYLKIEPSVQRSGFASRFNADAFQRYADAGVDDVTVTASLDAGGYVWARTGFELASEGADESARALDRAKQIRELVENARSEGFITKRQFDRLTPRLVGDDGKLEPDTLTSVRELAQMPIGERVLKGQSWSGIRPMETRGPWYSPTGRSGLVDARESAAYLRPAEERPEGVRQAEHAIRALVPEQLDLKVMATRLERATRDTRLHLVRTSDAATELDLVRREISTTLPMDVMDDAGQRVGSVTFGLRADERGRLIATRNWDHEVAAVDRRGVNASVNRVLRDAGVDRLEYERANSPEYWWVTHTRSVDL